MIEKVRIHEIAKELGIPSKNVLLQAIELKFNVKSAQSVVSMVEAETIANYIMNDTNLQSIKKKKMTKKTVKQSIPPVKGKESTSLKKELVKEETKKDNIKNILKIPENTNLKKLGYCTEDIVGENILTLTLKKIIINILYKKIMPLSIFEKYIIKVIDEASKNKINLVEKSQDAYMVDIFKIAEILSIDTEIIDKYIETLSISGSIKLENSSLIVIWDDNLKNWKKEVIEENQKDFLLTEGDCENFLNSTKVFQKNFLEQRYLEDSKIFYDYEIISVNEDKVNLKTSIILDKDSGELKAVFEQDDKIYTLSKEISSGTQLKSINHKKLELLNQINFSQEQIDAINATEKYILLKARAGSGKTAVITQRTQRLLKEGIHSDEILLLAFNKDAAQEMNKRVSSCFNNAKTFHSFASSIVNPKNIDEEKRSDILKDEFLSSFLQDIIKDNYKSSAQCSFFKQQIENEFSVSDKIIKTTKRVELFISYAKQEMLNSEDLQLRIKYSELDDRIKKFLSFANFIYEKYEVKKDIKKQMDYNDLLIKSIDEMTSFDVSNFKHIIIDEFQDFSLLFSKIIDKIIKFNPDINIFAVGDDWQAINSFAGANIDFFNNFSDKFKSSKQMKILTNYRSPSEIVRYSNNILEGEDANYNSIGGKVLFSDEECTEASIIKIKAENPNKTIAVLVHNNYEKKDKENNYFDIDGVIFKTVHKSKGLQFDIIIIKDASKFGYMHPNNKLYKIFKKEEEYFIDEERRLFYVAVTRAKEKVYIFGKPQFKLY